MSDEARQAIIDGEHLRILSICYIVSGGINAFFSLFGLFYASMGLFLAEFISRLPPQPNQPPPPEFIGFFFGIFGLGMFTVMVALAALKFLVARRLKQHRSRVLCMVVAGLTCLGIPFGTALGVFTFVVLARPSVARLFDAQTSPATGTAPTGGGA